MYYTLLKSKYRVNPPVKPKANRIVSQLYIHSLTEAYWIQCEVLCDDMSHFEN